jgi:hypothetical protein
MSNGVRVVLHVAATVGQFQRLEDGVANGRQQPVRQRFTGLLALFAPVAQFRVHPLLSLAGSGMSAHSDVVDVRVRTA